MADANLSYAIIEGANLCKTTWFRAYLPYVYMPKVKLCNATFRHNSLSHLKCRCNKAKVLRIEELEGSPAETNFVSDDYVYTVGEITVADSFDKDRWNDSTGIDFFIAREMAVIYEKK